MSYIHTTTLTTLANEGLRLIFDWLEETHEGYQLDVIGLCGEFCEATVDDMINEYEIQFGCSGASGQDALNWIEECSILIGQTPEGLIFLNF